MKADLKIKIKRLDKKRGQPYYKVCGAKTPEMSDDDDNDADMPQCSVPTSNRFTPIAKNGIDIPASAYKIKKPAPIVVPASQISKMANELTSLNGKYSLKRISDGSVKLFPADFDAQAKIKDIFARTNIQHYSFLEADERLHKYVLYGLNKVEPEELIDEIKRASGDKLVPKLVKEMRINKPKYDDHHNYLIYFSTNPTLPALQNCKQLWYSIVRWDHYRNKFQGPSRCTNCQSFGHGAIKCGMNSKCVACAGDHRSSECPLLLEKRRHNKTHLDASLLKCCHCGSNHTASFLDCPKRQLYIETKKAANRNYRGSMPTPPTNSYNSTSNYNNNYPQYKPRNRPVLGDITSTISHAHINDSIEYNNHSLPQQSSRNNSDLFTLDQLNIICAEMMSKLSVCKTKEDQFLLMFNLATKYVYGNR